MPRFTSFGVTRATESAVRSIRRIVALSPRAAQNGSVTESAISRWPPTNPRSTSSAPSGGDALTSAASVRWRGRASGFGTRSPPRARDPGTAGRCENQLAPGPAEPRRVALGSRRERARDRHRQFTGVAALAQGEPRVPEGRGRRRAQQAVGVRRWYPGRAMSWSARRMPAAEAFVGPRARYRSA